MSELDQLRQEAEQLKNQIRVSSQNYALLSVWNWEDMETVQRMCIFLNIMENLEY